jgi:hypothetical protein
MHFLIDIKFTRILNQFKQKEIRRFIYDMQFPVFFYILNLIFVNCKKNLKTLWIKNIYFLITSPRTNCRIIPFLKNYVYMYI